MGYYNTKTTYFLLKKYFLLQEKKSETGTYSVGSSCEVLTMVVLQLLLSHSINKNTTEHEVWVNKTLQQTKDVLL